MHLNSNVKSLRLVLWMSCGLSYKLFHVYFKRMRFLFLLVTFLHVLKSIWFIAVFMSSIFLVTFCLFFYQLLREKCWSLQQELWFVCFSFQFSFCLKYSIVLLFDEYPFGVVNLLGKLTLSSFYHLPICLLLMGN